MRPGLVGGATLLALLLTSGPAAAAPSLAELAVGVDRVFGDIDERTMPGCAVGVVHDGHYVLARGYGLANLEHEIPVTTRSVFRIGSVSKQFTAMAIAILAERGDLDLDADVHDYVPELRDYGQPVTIRQMIHHVAGMGDYDEDLFVKADGQPFRFGNEDYMTTAEFFDKVKAVPLRRKPGETWEYSNLGYFLLGQVVERVSGKTLREFAAAEIFGPLGMRSTFFNDNVDQPVPNRAGGYRRMDDGSYEMYMTNLDWVGDGGVFTTIDDFIEWDRNFYDNRLGKGSAALIEQVTSPLPGVVARDNELFGQSGYAFGYFVGTSHGEPVIGHTGGWVGFSSVYFRYPDLRLSVVTFCNSTDHEASEFGNRIAEIYVRALRPE